MFTVTIVLTHRKISADIRRDHIKSGKYKERKRKNHKSTEKLLEVPRYRDLLEDMEDEDETERGRLLINSADGWRVEMARWTAAMREADEDDCDTELDIPGIPENFKYTKMTLERLFGAQPKPSRRVARSVIDEEAALMEALADAEEDSRPDDGAIEVSDDDYVE